MDKNTRVDSAIGNFNNNASSKLKITDEDIIVNGRIVSISSENTVADASQIWDSDYNGNQQRINKNIRENIWSLDEAISDNYNNIVKLNMSVSTLDSELQKTNKSVTTLNTELDKTNKNVTSLNTELDQFQTETDTKFNKMQETINAIPKYKTQVVSTLPTSDISVSTIYLVKSSDESNNMYTEYIYSNNKWEELGKQSNLNLDEYTNLQKVTYAELIDGLNNSTLIPGKQYQITDYNLTVNQYWNSSGNMNGPGLSVGPGLFDVIVTANATDSIDSEARATWHEGDTYFEDQKLDAWRIWYDPWNNYLEYPWCDYYGKGCIYRMIDESGNDIPYDFKHMMFPSNRYRFWNEKDSQVCLLYQLAFGNDGTYESPSFNMYTFSYANYDYDEKVYHVADASLWTKEGSTYVAPRATNVVVKGAIPNNSEEGSAAENLFCPNVFLMQDLTSAYCKDIVLEHGCRGNVLIGCENVHVGNNSKFNRIWAKDSTFGSNCNYIMMAIAPEPYKIINPDSIWNWWIENVNVGNNCHDIFFGYTYGSNSEWVLTYNNTTIESNCHDITVIGPGNTFKSNVSYISHRSSEGTYYCKECVINASGQKGNPYCVQSDNVYVYENKDGDIVEKPLNQLFDGSNNEGVKTYEIDVDESTATYVDFDTDGVKGRIIRYNSFTLKDLYQNQVDVGDLKTGDILIENYNHTTVDQDALLYTAEQRLCHTVISVAENNVTLSTEIHYGDVFSHDESDNYALARQAIISCEFGIFPNTGEVVFLKRIHYLNDTSTSAPIMGEYTYSQLYELVNAEPEEEVSTLVDDGSEDEPVGMPTKPTGKLIPGAKYILTDYEHDVNWANTPNEDEYAMSWGKGNFYIVLTAQSTNTFYDEVQFMHDPNDEYFKYQKLSAWKGWFSFYVDMTMYPWAYNDVYSNGSRVSGIPNNGVITRLIDEHGNDLPYDFKHIMFNLDHYTIWNRYSQFKRTLRQMLAGTGNVIPDDITEVYSFIDSTDYEIDGSMSKGESYIALGTTRPACVDNVVNAPKPGRYMYGSDRGRFLNNVFVDASGTRCSSSTYGNVVQDFNNSLQKAVTSSIVIGGYNTIESCSYIHARMACTWRDCAYLNCGSISYITCIGFMNDRPTSIDDIIELTTYNSSTTDRTYVKKGNDGVLRVYHYNNLLHEHQSLADYAKTADVNTALATKQDKLTAGANITISGNTISAATQSFTQTQSDWNETNTSSAAYIKNKPTIPTVPTKVSAFTNDAGYLTQHQSLAEYVKSSNSTVKDAILVSDLPSNPTATTVYFIAE